MEYLIEGLQESVLEVVNITPLYAPECGVNDTLLRPTPTPVGFMCSIEA